MENYTQMSFKTIKSILSIASKTIYYESSILHIKWRTNCYYNNSNNRINTREEERRLIQTNSFTMNANYKIINGVLVSIADYIDYDFK